MAVDYQKDVEENKEFDKTLNPKGDFQRPSVEQLKQGVKIRNKSRYRSGEGSEEFLKKTSKFLQDNQPTPADISEGLVDAKATHTASMLGGSILGEYLPLPKGTGAVVGGAIGYAASRAKRELVDFTFNQAKRVWEDGVGWVYRSLDGSVAGKTLEELWQNTQARVRGIQSMATGEGLTQSGTGMKTGGGGKRFNWKDLDSKVLWRAANQDQRVIAKAQATIDMLDDWRLSHSDLDRPMTGYVKEHGKPTFWSEGKEWGIGWSRKKNNYEIYDVQARIDSRAARLAGDKTSNPESASLRQIKEAFRRDLNKQAAELPVEQWDIMIQNPGDAYIEHLIAVKSPFWKTQRGKNVGYLAGDSKNLKVLTDQNFKKLKDSVERTVHARHKDFYVDYDPNSQNLILRNLKTGEALPTQIPGIGDATQARVYIEDALASRPMRDIVDINPKTPSNVQRQIQKVYFADLDDITSNAIIDRIRGKSWSQIRKEYGNDFSKRQLNLATDKYNNLTKSEVMAIMKAYGISGKGRTRY